MSAPEQMSRARLRSLFDEWFCPCGNPEYAAATMLALLRAHDRTELEDGKRRLDRWREIAGGDGPLMLILYLFDQLKLTEHGGSVWGGWLTDLGEQVRDALAREEGDEFDALFDDSAEAMNAAVEAKEAEDAKSQPDRCGYVPPNLPDGSGLRCGLVVTHDEQHLLVRFGPRGATADVYVEDGLRPLEPRFHFDLEEGRHGDDMAMALAYVASGQIRKGELADAQG